MTKRIFTRLFLLPILLFFCYYNTGVAASVAPLQIEAENKQNKAVHSEHHIAYYLLPEEPFTLEKPEEKYPNRKYKLADKHRFNSSRYKIK